jgi:hypothetical protein
MYKQQADSLDPDFFYNQVDILRLWHLADPVDSLESFRNDLIASYQGGYKNPFILDSTLVPRALLPDPQSLSQKREITPTEFHVKQSYPNPFNPTTTIEFSIPKADFVTLKVYNILGEEVATLVSERLAAGSYKYDWPARSSGGDASSLASGVYLYRIQAGEYRDTKKMVLLR